MIETSHGHFIIQSKNNLQIKNSARILLKRIYNYGLYNDKIH